MLKNKPREIQIIHTRVVFFPPQLFPILFFSIQTKMKTSVIILKTNFLEVLVPDITRLY